MNIKKDMNLLEKKIADRLGMNRHPQSGGNIWKGDMSDELFLIDLKYTYGKNQTTIKKSELEKLDNEAFEQNPSKIPVMMISISGFERMVISVEDWLLFRELLRKTKEN